MDRNGVNSNFFKKSCGAVVMEHSVKVEININARVPEQHTTPKENF